MDSLGYTALILASVYDNIEIIEVLLTYNNLDINKRSNVSDLLILIYLRIYHKDVDISMVRLHFIELALEAIKR